MVDFRKMLENSKKYEEYSRELAMKYDIDLNLLRETCTNLCLYTGCNKLHILDTLKEKLEENLSNKGLKELNEYISKL